MEEAPFSLEILLGSPAETAALGARIATSLAPGDAVALEGDLGAGKTTCVRAFLRACGVSGLIRSPTYTLVETYRLDGRAPPLTCVHVDLYRLEGAGQVDELGLRDFMTPGHLLLIEWPQKGTGALPPPDLLMSLEFAAGGRAAQVHAGTERGSTWLTNLRDDARLASYLSNLT